MDFFSPTSRQYTTTTVVTHRAEHAARHRQSWHIFNVSQKMNPSGQCFISGPRGYFHFEEAYSPPRTAKLFGLFNGFHEKKIVFDATGKKWRTSRIRSRWKKSWWLTLLVNTVFNPRVDIEIRWRVPEPYALDDLKRIYLKAVSRDDDILTQFIEAEVLKKKIAEAQSFESLVAIYNFVDDDNDDTNGG